MKQKIALCLLAALLVFAFQAAASDLSIESISTASGNPGANVELTVVVKNNGAVNMPLVTITSTQLSNNGNSIQAPTISSITNLEAGATAERKFNILLPSVPAGVYSGKLTASDNGSNSDEENYSVTINPYTDFSLSPASLRITAQPNAVSRGKFTITNTGSNVLTVDISANGDFKDEEDDEITITFSSLAPLNPGQSAEVTINVDAESKIDLGEYQGQIVVKSGGIEKTIPLKIEVEPKMCPLGIVGDLQVSIENPGDDEEFNPGDTINVKAEVRNSATKSMDAIVEAVLFDATDNKKISSVKSDYKRIGDGNSKSFDLSLEVPIDESIDEEHEYFLYVKAYKRGDDDAQCHYAKQEITIERGENNVIITDFSLSATTAKCGDAITATVTVENIGTDDQENVIIKLRAKEFQIELKSLPFHLDRYDDLKTRHTETFEFNVPNDLKAGVYSLVATVEYGSSDSNSRIEQITLTECDYKPPTAAKVSLAVSETSIIVKPGVTKFVVPLTISNTGGKPANIKLDVADADGWAEVISIEAPEMLYGNEKYNAYIYMQLKGNVAEGVHNLRVYAKDPSLQGWLDSKLVSVDVQGLQQTEQSQEEQTINSILSNKSKLFWIIGDVLLVIIALVFLRMLLK